MSQEQPQNKQEVALVTGCSTGIGLATAVTLAVKGFKVYATMRDLKKADALKAKAEEKKTSVELLPLDVTSQQSVDECVKTILAKEGRIDILVNNAGFGHATVLEHSTMEQIRGVFEVDFFGLACVTKAVLPSMRKHKYGRVVNVSSIGGLVSQPFNEVYCAAKFAVEGLTEGMACTLSELGIHCSLIEPGPVATEFVNRVLTDMKQSEKPMPNDEYAPIFADYMKAFAARRGTSALQTPDDIADIILTCVQAEKPHLRYLTSDYVTKLAGIKLATDLDGDKTLAHVKAVTLGRAAPAKQE